MNVLKALLGPLKGRLLTIPGRYRRWRLVSRTRLLAYLMGIDLTIDIHPSVQIERGATFKLTRGMPINIKIDENVVIEEGFHVAFFANVGYSPTLLIGPYTQIHRNVSFTVSGTLELKGFDEIGLGTTIRAAQSVQMGVWSGSGEYASIFDFFHAADETWHIAYQTTLVSLPVKIGNFVLIASKATVNPGCVLSDMALVMPNSVVSGVWTEPMQMLGGIPAKFLNKPETFPLMQNPFIRALMTWEGDKPGPNFKSVEEARKIVPEPTAFDAEKHGWAHVQRLLQERVSAEEAKKTLEKIQQKEAESAAERGSNGDSKPKKGKPVKGADIAASNDDA